MRRWPGRIAHILCACLGLFALMAHGEESPQLPIEAVWKSQRVTFQYSSEGRLYSCDLLEAKIKMILSQLGARDRMKVRRLSCRDFAGFTRHEVDMESPVAATAENIREITDYDTEDELIARVRGVQLPGPADLERFPAVWEQISFRRAPKVRLEARDCELVQQLRRQVLPKMSVQVIKDIERVDCSSLSGPRLTVLVLVATL